MFGETSNAALPTSRPYRMRQPCACAGRVGLASPPVVGAPEVMHRAVHKICGQRPATPCFADRVGIYGAREWLV
ncbi:hypothetical protein PATSB16_06110 [Pandoraea thiooxydans]|nr:hypothetical protein PATSB16_06110 [Pandoraea thiooxydans]